LVDVVSLDIDNIVAASINEDTSRFEISIADSLVIDTFLSLDDIFVNKRIAEAFEFNSRD
jgi:hypothetical protein